MKDQNEDRKKLLNWREIQIHVNGRGAVDTSLEVDPAELFWRADLFDE